MNSGDMQTISRTIFSLRITSTASASDVRPHLAFSLKPEILASALLFLAMVFLPCELVNVTFYALDVLPDCPNNRVEVLQSCKIYCCTTGGLV